MIHTLKALFGIRTEINVGLRPLHKRMDIRKVLNSIT